MLFEETHLALPPARPSEISQLDTKIKIQVSGSNEDPAQTT
jgi:hypothetical protein